MTDTKLTFPRLKCLSEYTPTSLVAKSRTMNTIATDNARPSCLSLHERLSTIKYQYVNKSPHYFKSQRNLGDEGKEQKMKEIKTNQSIENYLAQQGKMLDKEMLLSYARSRVRKNRKRVHSQLKKQQEMTTLTSQRQLSSLEETKYSNFRAMKMPTKHAIRGIKHPDLTLQIRLS